jgi:alpha-glucosidase
MSNSSPLERRSWAVTPADSAWNGCDWQVDSSTTGLITVQTSHIRVIVDQTLGTVSFADAQNMVFCADARPATFDEEGVAVNKILAAGERFYGFGERTGLLEKTGQRYTCWTTDPEHTHSARVDEMYAVFPNYLALRDGRAYGVFFNTTFRSSFDIGASDAELVGWRTQGPELDYYVVFGPTPAAVTRGWAELLGSTPLPPRWALGYHQSRWGYDAEPTMRGLAAEFRGRGLPCDAIHFDIDYMRGYRVFTWNPETFPDPARLIGDLAGDGFKVVTIIDPGVKTDPDYHVFREGLEQDRFIRRADGSLFSGYVWPDDSAFADYTRPAVREWWGELQRPLLELGVRGIWDDMNEPTVFDRPFSEGGGNGGTIDLDAPQGDEAERTTHAEVHNLYGLLMARATREGMLAARPDERPFVLTRSGFSGLQRWATLWTGDNSSLWEHLEMSLPQICNIGLSGVPFCGVDIGGFFGDASAELWARWVQVGAFLPFCRGHSCSGTRAAEPWVYGERTESIARAYLTLRYRLLPYLYTLFQQAAATGAPIIRPLFYEFPGDASLAQLHDQVLCGPNLLLAPILRPGQEHRAVYLPEGEWYDWWTGERIRGPIHLLAHAPLERLPLYVRGGAILTLGPAMEYTDQAPLDTLTLDIYPAGASEWTLYEDDGISFEFERGQSATTTFRCVEGEAGLTVSIEERSGGWTPAPRTLLFNIHGRMPSRVLIDGAETSEWAYDDAALTLQLADDGMAHEVAVEF